MINRTEKYFKDLKTVDIDNPCKELTQEEVRLVGVKERVRAFMTDFNSLVSNSKSILSQPPSVDFFFKVLEGADVFMREMFVQPSGSDEELHFFVHYSMVHINDTLRRVLCDIATYNQAPDNVWMLRRNEMFRRRNELSMTNLFRRTFVESYIDNEVYKRFYQNKANGVDSTQELNKWDDYFNYIAKEYNENGYLRNLKNTPLYNTPLNNALETMRSKLAINFYKT